MRFLILQYQFDKMESGASWAASGHYYLPGQAVGRADEMVVDRL